MMLFLFAALSLSAFAETPVLKITLHDAEIEVIKGSNLLKSSISEEEASDFHRKSQFAALLPRLSVEGSYQYITTVPEMAIGNLPPIRLTTNSMYSVGPVLRYTLWDSFSAKKGYDSVSKLAEARVEDRKNTELQLLLSTRISYVQVQLASEELRLVNNSLSLARAQNRDISTRFKSGAASRLDSVTSERTVLNYELQFKQRQTNLSATLKDLLALLNDTGKNAMETDLSHPGPLDVDQVSLVLQLDSLADSISNEGQSGNFSFNEDQPQLKSLKLQAEASDLAASGQTAKLFPVIQVSAKTSFDYPNGPIAEQIHQNTLMLGVSLPFYLGDPTWHLASEKRKEAEAERFRGEQLRIDIGRDFRKLQEQLNSLHDQRDLAAKDVKMSEEVANLYYNSYKAGKSNILDVQTANNLALQAKVNAARLDAQMLSQIDTLKALSGKESHHD